MCDVTVYRYCVYVRLYKSVQNERACTHTHTCTDAQTNTHMQLCTISRLACPSLRVQPLV